MMKTMRTMKTKRMKMESIFERIMNEQDGGKGGRE